MNHVPRTGAVLLASALAGLLAGCGGSGENLAKVKGKLVKGGQPFQAQLSNPKFPEGEGVGLAQVLLYPVKSDKDAIVDDNGDTTTTGGAQAATVKADGTFDVLGFKGRGIPPGKYRFVIKQIDPLTEKDHLANRFSEQGSRVTRDVSDGAEIVIDLAKVPGG